MDSPGRRCATRCSATSSSPAPPLVHRHPAPPEERHDEAHRVLVHRRRGEGRRGGRACAAEVARRSRGASPPAITQLTGFGERAVWSPDGKRIAFMAKSFGDAFEIDLGTRLTRLLTGHFRHAGFLRVHYLSNGDYFLIGARDFKDINTTRGRDQEMWVMKAGARTPPVALGHKISEGV